MMLTIKLWSVIALGMFLAVTAAYKVGKREGRQSVATVTLQASIELLRERKLTDEHIQGMSDADLCTALGGVLADGRCQ